MRATGYGLSETVDEYLRRCREDLLLLVQVESAAGVEAIPEIARVDGVDGIFLGPYDLSASLGKGPSIYDVRSEDIVGGTILHTVDTTGCFWWSDS